MDDTQVERERRFLHAVVDDGSWQRGREIADTVPPSDATQTERRHWPVRARVAAMFAEGQL